MKKINKKQKLIVIISIAIITIILAILITKNIISNNNQVANEKYLATTANAGSNLIASYIQKGVTIGGITGTLEVLDTSDATATPEDIAEGKTAYVDGKKITGTRPKTVEGVQIPNGFYYVGGTKDTGIIISDNQEDENKGAGYDVSLLKGNQFVWVPVENPNSLFREVEEGVKLTGVDIKTYRYSNLKIWSGDGFVSVAPGDTSGVREPELLMSNDIDEKYYKDILEFESTEKMAESFVLEYKEMSDSIKKYKGFYIGRYELTGSVDNPSEKSGKPLDNQNWYNLYKACKNIINMDNVKSTMIYGIQWDAVCQWLKESGYNTEVYTTSWGNYTGTIINTGSNREYEANGIFDISGNCFERTQEVYSAYWRVGRGGGTYYTGGNLPVSARYYFDPSSYTEGNSSRATLYIK